MGVNTQVTDLANTKVRDIKLGSIITLLATIGAALSTLGVSNWWGPNAALAADMVELKQEFKELKETLGTHNHPVSDAHQIQIIKDVGRANGMIDHMLINPPGGK